MLMFSVVKIVSPMHKNGRPTYHALQKTEFSRVQSFLHETQSSVCLISICVAVC